MERKGEATKHQLAESFKELMLKGSFDKITIRMITEQAGVIRPTFYNYFQDKYEVMEWLLEEEVFRPVFEMVESRTYSRFCLAPHLPSSVQGRIGAST